MRLTLIFIVFFIFSGYANSNAQNQLVTLDLKEASFFEIFDKINEQTGLRFVYKSTDIKHISVSNLQVKNKDIVEFLDELLEDTPLGYIFEGDVVVLVPKTILQAKQLTIEGTVVDETGETIIGATILIKGTTQGVVTDKDGKFKITVPEGDQLLIISYIGYKSQEVKATPDMRIVLKREDQEINEVVVTGMVQMDRRMFTGATDRLNADDIKLDGMPDVSRALEGRSAGVTVQNVSGTFGSAPKIRVRGSTSILGSSKPLWVVDGVIIEDVSDISSDDLSTGDATTLISSAVAGLSADDIKDFQILKDGSATSIYGARAMAGVIVITTKRGKAGEAKVSYTGEFTTRLKPSYREFDIMNSQDQMGIYKELDNKGWLKLERVLRYQNSGVYGQMYRLINSYDEDTGEFGLTYNTSAMNAYLRRAEMRNTDWFDELFSAGIMQQHSVSISSGTEKASNYISISVMDDPGWYKRSNVQRFTARANSSIHIRPNFTLELLSSASYRKQKAPGTMKQEINTVYGEVKRNFDINPFSYAMNTSRTIAADEYHTRNYTDFNIHEELENNYMDVKIIDATFQAQVTYKPSPELSLKALGALKYSSNSMQWHVKEQANAARAYRAMSDATIMNNNKFLYTNPDDPHSLPVSVLPEGGIFEKTELRMLTYDFRADATYNKRINDDNYLQLFGGIEVNKIERSRDWFQGWGMLYEYGELANFDYLALKKLDEEAESYFTLRNSNKRNVAFFAMATYSYLGKYTLNGTFRYEGTNRMGRVRSARWLPTWNVSGSWQINEEAFFTKVSHIFTDMRLRASYSLTADAGPAWVTNSTDLIYSTVRWRPTSDTQETGVYINESANENLTYEKKHELNLGLDFGLLNDRLSFQTDVYWRNNFDLIGRTSTQGISGEIRRYANVADMKSRGIEVTISSKNIVTPTFKWSSHLTFSRTKNKITNLISSTTLMNLVRASQYSLQGYATESLFSIPFTGLDKDGLPTFKGPYDYQPSWTQDNYSDISFQITDEDVLKNYLKYEGPSDPTFTGGFSNTFSYKNLGLSVFMTYGFGNKIRLRPVFAYRYSDLTASSEVFKNRWMVPGDEKHTTVPVISSYRQYRGINNTQRGYSAYNYSDERVAHGDFIRMKEIALTYNVSKAVLRMLRLDRISLKLAAVNPFLIYADKALNGQDPEFIESGGVSSPIAKQFTFTVRIGL